MQRTGKYAVCAGVAIAALGLSTGSASAQALAIQGNHFTVDGSARFLKFVTYFDALDVPAGQLETDFNLLKNAVHVDGIRILPNWLAQASRTTGRTNAGNTVMDENGNLRGGPWNQLIYVLDRARAYGLVVDVTWTAETVGPPNTSIAALNYGNYRAALGTVTAAMASPRFNHVLFDLQNESNIHGPLGGGLDDNAARDLTQFVHAIDPGRIVTVSVDQNMTPTQARQRADFATENVVAWHEKRQSNWYSTSASDVPALRASGKPAYLQEPPKFEDVASSAESFLRAAEEAKRAGAAAWCYHTSAGQWMDAGTGANPNGGIWDRFTLAAPDSNPIDNGLIANLSPRLDPIPWPAPDGGGGGGGGEVVFYEHINFGGASIPFTGDVDFVGWDWNDRISSIHIPPGRTVTLYQDWHFGGGSITLSGDILDLRDYGWNDWASSLSIH